MIHALVAAVVLAAADGPLDPKKELDALQGTYTLVEAVIEGGPAPADELKKVTVVIKGDQFLFREDNQEEAATIKFGAAGPPKEIDIVPSSGTRKGKTLKGIYELTGDTLKICGANEEGAVRPTKFEAPKGSGCALLVLKRAKP